MRIVLLGTGTPGPNPNRRQSAVAIDIGADRLLFDAGSGAVHQMACAGLLPIRVNPIFLTHHHFDHLGDLFDVLAVTAMSGRENPMRIIGPPGTTEIVRGLLDVVYARDIRSRYLDAAMSRAHGVELEDPHAIRLVDVVETDGSHVESGDGWTVRTAEVCHGDMTADPEFNWRCLGYRIEAGEKVVAISGDTVPCDGLRTLADGADVLIQCCHCPESRVNEPAVALLTRETLPSAGQVGSFAATCNVGRIVLTHISMHADTPETLEAMRRDVAGTHDCDVIVGQDLMVIDV